jgi:hypothetical protein
MALLEFDLLLGPIDLKHFQMSDVTVILNRVEEGDPKAAEELLPLVYDELRRLANARMASEAAEHTLQPTALVHEAWLRLSTAAFVVGKRAARESQSSWREFLLPLKGARLKRRAVLVATILRA